MLWPARGGAETNKGSTPAIMLVAVSCVLSVPVPPETTTASPGFNSLIEILGRRSIICDISPFAERMPPPPLGRPAQPPPSGGPPWPVAPPAPPGVLPCPPAHWPFPP